MTHFYDISYAVFEEDSLYKNGTLGLMHTKKCIDTTIKILIKRMLPAEKKTLKIVITNCEQISEEEAKRRFGINIYKVSFKQRLVR